MAHSVGYINTLSRHITRSLRHTRLYDVLLRVEQCRTVQNAA